MDRAFFNNSSILMSEVIYNKIDEDHRQEEKGLQRKDESNKVAIVLRNLLRECIARDVPLSTPLKQVAVKIERDLQCILDDVKKYSFMCKTDFRVRLCSFTFEDEYVLCEFLKKFEFLVKCMTDIGSQCHEFAYKVNIEQSRFPLFRRMFEFFGLRNVHFGDCVIVLGVMGIYLSFSISYRWFYFMVSILCVFVAIMFRLCSNNNYDVDVDVDRYSYVHNCFWKVGESCHAVALELAILVGLMKSLQDVSSYDQIHSIMILCEHLSLQSDTV